MLQEYITNLEQQIVDQIILTIDKFYPDAYITDNEISQGIIDGPAFFIACIGVPNLQDRIQPAGFFYTCSFDVLFEPADNSLHKDSDLRQAEYTLLLALRHFGRYRADGLNATILDGDLHITFTVTIPLKYPDPVDPVIEKLDFEDEVEIING